MQRLVLIRHATTAAVRGAAFPLDEPLDEAGSAAARSAGEAMAAVRLPGLTRGAGVDHWCGPSERARETARLLGLDATVVPRLDEADFGAWRGRSLADVNDEAPEAVAAWLGDPAAAPHGGESLVALQARVAGWLAEVAGRDGRTIAVTSGGVIKAAITVALGAPPEAAWRVDASPLHQTVLHAHDGRWTLRAANAPLGGGSLDA